MLALQLDTKTKRIISLAELGEALDTKLAIFAIQLHKLGQMGSRIVKTLMTRTLYIQFLLHNNTTLRHLCNAR